MSGSVLETHPKLTKSIDDVREVVGLGNQILELCNGRRSIREIIMEFLRKYPNGDKELLATETMNALFNFKQRGILDF